MNRSESSRQNIKKAILVRKKMGVEKAVKKAVSLLRDSDIGRYATDCFVAHGVKVEISEHENQ